jgi:4-hydroxybenzoate polyprenyltransferase
MFGVLMKNNKNKNNKKNYSLIEKVFGFIELARPIEWSKPLLNMSVAGIMAFYFYSQPLDFWLIVKAFFSVAFLWSGLYALNDFTDWKIDALHKIKKARAIPSGRVTPNQGLIFSLLLVLSAFVIGSFNSVLVLCLGAMTINQLLYTMKPFRLKSRKVFDMISGSLVNPFFRYFSLLVVLVPLGMILSSTPLLPILFVCFVQFSGYSLYRLASKTHDSKTKMKSTAALIPESIVKLFSYSGLFIGGIAYLGMFANNFLNISFLGTIPLKFGIPIVFVALSAPLFKNALLNPTKMDMKFSYRLTYAATVFVALSNFVILFLF